MIVDSKSLLETQSEGSTIGTLYLVEEFVDEEYKLEKVTENCMWFFSLVKELPIYPGKVILLDKPKGQQVGQLNQIPVSFRDIVMVAEKNSKTEFAASQWMRMLWKFGKVRRFYKGYWQKAMPSTPIENRSTGTKHGVRYIW